MILLAQTGSTQVDWWPPTAQLIAGALVLITALINIFGPGLARKMFGTSPDAAARNATRNVRTIETTLTRTLDLIETKMSGLDDKIGDVAQKLAVLLDRVPRTAPTQVNTEEGHQ